MNNTENQVPEQEILVATGSNILERSFELKSVANNIDALTPFGRELEQSSSLYNLRSIWENSQGRGIRVAVLDTGLDTLHPAFPAIVIKRAVRINNGVI